MSLEFGKSFQKPPISDQVIPGGWTKMSPDKNPVNNALAFCLKYIESTFNVVLPENVKVCVYVSGVQVVSGMNMYVEGKISGSDDNADTYQFQALVYDPLFGTNGSMIMTNVHVQVGGVEQKRVCVGNVTI